ncbi:unnamed protein product [Soboliphyme baturini]|uniref:NFACT RNA-binding domain-containing protein n=1 Tax=Soboliphyme baturini TaxID=241478 RepID=A0A3P7ZNY9_9BILA|nr:unnamed protein product [Soboliphyme baturini]
MILRPDAKVFLLFESGCCIYKTEYEWPKNIIPSSFAMKLRKHMRQKRLESVSQLGLDRVINMQFGSNTFAAHVIVELYDRGNIILTDHEYTILNVLRPRTDADSDVKFIVRETYPLHLIRQVEEPSQNEEMIRRLLDDAKPNDNLRRVLISHVVYGPALLEHCFRQLGFSLNWSVKKYNDVFHDSGKICVAFQNAQQIFRQIRDSPCRGYIVYSEKQTASKETVQAYEEYHPYLFDQHKELGCVSTWDSFTAAVDEFYSKLETQKLDLKALQQEKTVLQKLDNIRSDHHRRLAELQQAQQMSTLKGRSIQENCEQIDSAILLMRTALANQLSWDEIQEQVEEAAEMGDPLAKKIVRLNLKESRFVMALKPSGFENEDEETCELLQVEIDVNLNAHQNACQYYQQKKFSALKESKTIEASKRALKCAEVKTKHALKDVAVKTNILKARRTMWFEKFLWFLSSDSYLVIGGRDAQQNEIIVKRYLREGDVYVHADIRGATSVIVKNHVAASKPIPPKTLNEAGTMAVCFSAAWDAKVLTSAWWVHSSQVSKSAPAGEYLTTGSFMIRGRKNYLTPSQLWLGFGILFRLDEESTMRHMEKLKESSEVVSEDTASVENVEKLPNEASDTIDEADEVSVDPAIIEFSDVCGSLNYLSMNPTPFIVGQSVKLPPQERISKADAGRKLPDGSKADETDAKNGKKKAQKAKQKKRRMKYKNQDEDERALRMSILKSAGCGDATKVNAKSSTLSNTTEKEETPSILVNDESLSPVTEKDWSEPTSDSVVTEVQETSTLSTEVLEAEAEPEENLLSSAEVVNDISALTGDPADDDAILFAVPVCGPYSAMSSYMFKVKLAPGSNKKGKATKTALGLFLQDRSCSQRLKDLLKAIHVEDLSRNIPGKVKLYAPQLTHFKGKDQRPNSKV